jgi:GH25 family lysozyme M1 (1,4-beta-N-acetylmuramidase)
MPVIQGIDLSSVQGNITKAQWQALVDNQIRFAISKCGNGNDHSDPDFLANINGALATGKMVVGAYHFPFALPNSAKHSGRDPETQAAMHFQQCGGLGTSQGELPACCDCEWPRPEAWGKPIPGVDDSIVDQAFLQDWFSRYLVAYEALQGCPMMVYGDPWFLKHLAPPAQWARYPLWEAAYGSSVPAVGPWAGWCARQSSGGGGRLPGGAPVDTDVIADETTLSMLVARPFIEPSIQLPINPGV